LIAKFKSLGLLSVLTAGLIDGVNPCAFATIVFLISYLAFIKRKGKEILLIGIGFSFSVFITYFLIGIGIFSFIHSLKFFSKIHTYINYFIALFAITLGLISIKDYLNIKKGNIDEVKLKLSDKLRKKIRLSIAKRFKSSHLILAAIISGFLVSLFEFVCTGQIYLPTISLVTKIQGFKIQAFLYLILYNLMFILPLILVFSITYFGLNSTQINNFFQRHIAKGKLFSAIIFFILGWLLLL
jgi:cytochrome c biogenesis protein CcdA